MNNPSRHILIATPGFAADYSDTRCIPAIQLFVKELLNQGHYVSIIAVHYPYRKEQYDWHGANVIPLNGGNSRWKRKFSLFTQFKIAFHEVHSKRSVDVIHGFFLNEVTWFGGKLGAKYGIPVIASAQGQDVLPSNRYLRKVRSMNISFFGMSEFQTDLLEKEGFKVKTIEWGIPKQTVDLDKTIDVIAVGNLIPLKQFDYFIKLLANLKPINGKFVLVGGGPEEKKIRSLIDENDLDECVELKGILNHEETLALIAQSKVLVHPSEFEGFGMVIIEALLHRTAVLSSPVGISYQNNSISELTFDLDRDALELARLLEIKEIESVHYDIQETVTNYLNHYENSLRSVKNHR